MDRRNFLTSATSVIGASLAGSVAHSEGISLLSPYAVVLPSVIGTPKWDPKVTVPGFSLILPTSAPGNQGPYDVTTYLEFSRDGGSSWDAVPAKPEAFVNPYRAKSNGGVVEYVLIKERDAVVNLFIPHEVMYLKVGVVMLRFYVRFFKGDTPVAHLDQYVGNIRMRVDEVGGRVSRGVKGADFMDVFNLKTGQRVPVK